MTVEDEAGKWFAALRRGLMSTEERAAYESWMKDRENRQAIASMKSLWALLDGAPKPAKIADLTRKALLSAIVVSSITVAVISVAGNNHFWTALDWTNR